MKRIFVFLLTAVLAVSLCACQASQAPIETIPQIDESVDMTAVQDSFDKASAYIESLIDVSKMTVQTDDENPGFLYRSWLNDEDGELILNDEFEIDSKKITIGKTKESDLESLGMEVDKLLDTVEPNEVTSVSLIKDNKTCLINLMPNNTDKAQPIGDIAVSGFSAAASDYLLPFAYNGMTKDSSMEDVLKLFKTENLSVNLSADSMNTTISLSYFGQTREGDLVNDDSLTIDFLYDAASNTASFTSLNRNRNAYPATEE